MGLSPLLSSSSLASFSSVARYIQIVAPLYSAIQLPSSLSHPLQTRQNATPLHRPLPFDCASHSHDPNPLPNYRYESDYLGGCDFHVPWGENAGFSYECEDC